MKVTRPANENADVLGSTIAYVIRSDADQSCFERGSEFGWNASRWWTDMDD
jgi:hypothetical protein